MDRRKTAAPRGIASKWVRTDESLPEGTVWIWADGQPMVGVLVEGSDDAGPWQVFMDPRNCDLLPWPSHWQPIDPPE